ncbi:protoporphyrinogen oxidase [Sesbania bispinosa]|nr:protoporphyrinogen oxidase [Sesbania bispinosa]
MYQESLLSTKITPHICRRQPPRRRAIQPPASASFSRQLVVQPPAAIVLVVQPPRRRAVQPLRRSRRSAVIVLAVQPWKSDRSRRSRRSGSIVVVQPPLLSVPAVQRNGCLCLVEAFVEEEFAKVVERGEEKRVKGGIRGARWVGGFVRNVAEAEFNDVVFELLRLVACWWYYNYMG